MTQPTPPARPVLDANLLIYSVNVAAPQHPKAKAYVDDIAANGVGCHLTTGIVYEFLRVCTHRRPLPQPLTAEQAVGTIQRLVGSPGVSILLPTERHWHELMDLVRQYRPTGNILHDFHTVALMREHGLTDIATADAHFRRFPFLSVINPVV